jgi:hypothetical protein
MTLILNCMKKEHLVQTKSQPMNMYNFILYGRLEESVAGPLNGRGKRWQAMSRPIMGTLDASDCEDIDNAMLKAFTKEECNKVRRKTGY